MTQYANVETTLASAVANAGTFTVPYPTGFAQADFTGINAAAEAVMIVNNNDEYKETASQIAVSYDASEVTVTNSTGTTLPAGSLILMGLAYDGDVNALTDNSGGTSGGDTIAAVSDVATAANAIATLAAKVNQLRDRLVAEGLLNN